MGSINPFSVINYSNNGNDFAARKMSFTNPRTGEKESLVFVLNKDTNERKVLTQDAFLKELTGQKAEGDEKNVAEPTNERYSIRNIGATIDIVKNTDGTYSVTTKGSYLGAKPETKIISEEEFQAKYADRV